MPRKLPRRLSRKKDGSLEIRTFMSSKSKHSFEKFRYFLGSTENIIGKQSEYVDELLKTVLSEELEID